MELSLYDLLKERATCEETKDKVVYIENYRAIKQFTYNNLYNIVKEYIKVFANLDIKNKQKFVLVDNSIDSIAILIALLYCKAIPILINVFELQKRMNDNPLTYEDLIIKRREKLTYDYIISRKNYLAFPIRERECLENFLLELEGNLNILDSETDGERGFVIFTSGTTNNKLKPIFIKEKDLIEKGQINLEKNDESLYYNFTTIAYISGIVHCILIPLLTNSSIFLTNKFDLPEISEFKINKTFLPINIIDLLNDNLEQLDFSNLDKIYLGGGLIDLDTILLIRSKFKNLKDNVFINSYGSTENLGEICHCEEKDLKNIYINHLLLSNGIIVYTYDKKNIFMLLQENDKRIIKKVDIEYDDNIFFKSLPVSSQKNENIKIENDFLGEIAVNGVNTGDVGIYIDNKLYIICRKNDLCEINGKIYCLTSIEKIFDNFIGLKTIAIRNNHHNEIFLMINFKSDDYIYDNFKRIIPLVKKCEELIEKIEINEIKRIMFVESCKISKTRALAKTKKNQLLELIEKYDEFKYRINNYEEVFVSMVSSILKKNAKKEANIIYDNGIIKIPKCDIEQKDIFQLEKDCVIASYDEDEKYYKLVIDDCILFDLTIDDYISTKNYYSDISYSERYHIRGREVKPAIYYKRYYEERDRPNKSWKNSDKIHTLGIDGIYNVSLYGIKFLPEKIVKNSDYSAYIVRADNIYYDEIELQEDMKILESYLNHEYQLLNDGTFLVDGKIVNLDDDGYKQIYYLISYKYRQFYGILYKDKTSKERENLVKQFNNKNSILLLEKYQYTDYSSNFVNLSFINNFDLFGLCFLDGNYLNFEEQIEYILSLCREKYLEYGKYYYNNIVIFIEELSIMTFYPKDNLSNQYYLNTLSKMFQFFNYLRNKGCFSIFIDNEEYVFDFSDLKLIFNIIDPEFYNNSTKDNLLSLNYPKELYDNIDYIIRYENYDEQLDFNQEKEDDKNEHKSKSL